jgi:general stress protein 26
MEPFLPDNKFIIYLATNPLSRKVKEIKNNHRATLHYFDKNSVGYVSLMGKITIETNDSIKKSLWKAGWERFYKNQDDDYMLLKFTPDYLEVISITEGLTGDKKTWKPSRVNLYKSK